MLGARQSPETLEPLARQVDHTRRLAVAEDRVGNVLGALARDRWLVERYALIRGRRVLFLILGETGVFALWALSSPAQGRDPAFVHEVASDAEDQLPGYGGPVRGGIRRAFAPAIKPRWWCRAGEPGAWVMGLAWVIPWLEHFGTDHGLSVEDVERFKTLSGPHWDGPPARRTRASGARLSSAPRRWKVTAPTTPSHGRTRPPLTPAIGHRGSLDERAVSERTRVDGATHGRGRRVIDRLAVHGQPGGGSPTVTADRPRVTKSSVSLHTARGRRQATGNLIAI